jgi:hypothetical protein
MGRNITAVNNIVAERNVFIAHQERRIRAVKAALSGREECESCDYS